MTRHPLHFEANNKPHRKNRVMIDPQHTDQLGNFRPVIPSIRLRLYFRGAMVTAKKISDQIFARLGVQMARNTIRLMRTI